VEEQGHLRVESSIDPDGRTGRVTLSGEFDLDGVDAVSTVVDQLAERDIGTLLIDGSELTFLDSSGLRALLTAREKMQARGVRFRLVNASSTVIHVLDMTGTRTMLEG
jgi:anti-anti-sigma factor